MLTRFSQGSVRRVVWLALALLIAAIVPQGLALAAASPTSIDAAAPKPAYLRIDNLEWWLITYSSGWRDIFDGRAFEGSVTAAKSPQASASYTWTGTDVRVLAARDKGLGKLLVTVDGSTTFVDLYSSVSRPQQLVFIRENMAPGSHTVVLAPAGVRNPASSGIWIAVDAIDVR